MSLVSEIIQRSYRELNLIPIGTEPTAAEQSEGLTLLQGLCSSVYGNEMGEPLGLFPFGQNNVAVPSGYPWGNGYPPQEWWMPLNMRLVCNQTAAVIDPPVYLNPAPQDGSRFGVIDASNNFATFPLTISGNGRTIEGSTLPVVLNTDGVKRDWVYRADLGDWKRVSPLVLGDDWPWPDDFDDMFVIMLAMRMATRNSQPLSQESAAAMERSRTQFTARYTQVIPTPVDPGLLAPSVQTYPNNQNYYGSQPNTGDSGWAWPGVQSQW